MESYMSGPEQREESAKNAMENYPYISTLQTSGKTQAIASVYLENTSNN